MTERPTDDLDDAIDRVAAAIVDLPAEAAAAGRCRARIEAGVPVRPARLPWWAAPSAAAAVLALVLAWTLREPMPSPGPALRVARPAARVADAPAPGPVGREGTAGASIDPRRPANEPVTIAAASSEDLPRPSPHTGLPPIEAIDPLATERLSVAGPLDASTAMQPLSIDAIHVAPLSIDEPE
ncbi:MAG: hypothetical protein R2745_10885 [Vicinamibacterales bacterium]